MIFKKLFREIFRKNLTKKFSSSSDYWENRYFWGGNSGVGSYGNDATYKADILNQVIDQYNIDTIIDLGCGDGNNLQLYKIKNYFGFDISLTAIKNNIKKYSDHKNKKFYVINDNFKNILENIRNSDQVFKTIVLSFDVILHLVEDEIYFNHLKTFESTISDYLLVVSSDEDKEYNNFTPHVKHRNYSKDLEKKGWQLLFSKEILNDRDSRSIKLFKISKPDI